MDPKIESLLQRIRLLEDELEMHMALARAELGVHIENGKIEFEEAVRRRHRAIKSSLLRYVAGARPLVLLTASVIYLLIVPFALLDVFTTIYQQVCFPIYGIPRVKRKDYVIFDRRHLVYLNLVEKINCAYCSYANGVAAYVREIGSRTEQYWCPIKHARKLLGAHPRYGHFVAYGDAQGYRDELDSLRAEVRKTHDQ
ncbi:hypothetical protein [Rhodanobacter terrae]|uniref:Uncharacterized protein n=1 Tax=Rhodanobacter terrae TaxID=418647 RepID=A0ABW0SW93_9GAMM